MRISNRATPNPTTYDHNADLRPFSIPDHNDHKPQAQPAGIPEPGSRIRHRGSRIRGWMGAVGGKKVGLGGMRDGE